MLHVTYFVVERKGLVAVRNVAWPGDAESIPARTAMEDLLADPFPAWGLFGPRSRMAFRNAGSKVYMHRLLEAAPTPTLWTMNSPRGVSETILRRMMFALELRRPTPGDFAVVHRKAWFLGKHGEPEALADMLRAECDAKPDRPRPIGFRP